MNVCSQRVVNRGNPLNPKNCHKKRSIEEQNRNFRVYAKKILFLKYVQFV